MGWMPDDQAIIRPFRRPPQTADVVIARATKKIHAQAAIATDAWIGIITL